MPKDLACCNKKIKNKNRKRKKKTEKGKKKTRKEKEIEDFNKHKKRGKLGGGVRVQKAVR